MTSTDPDCPVCRHADEHGWWGQNGTHCRKCHRTWTGLREAHCVRCCAHFSTPENADMHVGVTECRDPATLVTRDGSPRLKPVQRASGPTWVGAGERPEALTTEGQARKALNGGRWGRDTGPALFGGVLASRSRGRALRAALSLWRTGGCRLEGSGLWRISTTVSKGLWRDKAEPGQR
jgi:hypothetical protein